MPKGQGWLKVIVKYANGRGRPLRLEGETKVEQKMPQLGMFK